jgi:hypothetical protein
MSSPVQLRTKKLISLVFPEKIEFKGKNIQLEESMTC